MNKTIVIADGVSATSIRLRMREVLRSSHCASALASLPQYVAVCSLILFGALPVATLRECSYSIVVARCETAQL